MTAEPCVCQQQTVIGALVQHKEDCDKKIASACTSATSAHKRIDQAEKEIVGMPTFRWTIGILVTVLIFIVGINATVLGKMDDKLDRVDKSVSVIEDRTEHLKPGKVKGNSNGT